MGAVESTEADVFEEGERGEEEEEINDDDGNVAKTYSRSSDEVARRLAPASGAVVTDSNDDKFSDCDSDIAAAEMDFGDALIQSMRHNRERIAFVHDSLRCDGDSLVVTYADVYRACEDLCYGLFRSLVRRHAPEAATAAPCERQSVRVGIMMQNSATVMVLHVAAAVFNHIHAEQDRRDNGGRSRSNGDTESEYDLGPRQCCIVLVNLNTSLVDTELAYIARDANVCCILCDNEFADVVSKARRALLDTRKFCPHW